jgi:hypothetical protein
VSEVSLKQLDAHTDALHEHGGALRKAIDAAYDSPDETPAISFTALRARARSARDHATAILDLLGERASDSKPRKPDPAGLMAAIFGTTEDPNASVERLLRDTHLSSPELHTKAKRK